MITVEMLENFKLNNDNEMAWEQACNSLMKNYGIDLLTVEPEVQSVLVDFVNDGATAALMNLIYTLANKNESSING